MDRLPTSLSVCSTKSAILSLVKGYSCRYIPKPLAPNLPLVPAGHFKPESLSINFSDLLQITADTKIVVSFRQCEAVEAATRGWANSCVWFWMRTRRITSSKFKAVCATDPAMPSAGLVMSVCHPSLAQFQTATIYHLGLQAWKKGMRDVPVIVQPTTSAVYNIRVWVLHPRSSPFHGYLARWISHCLRCGEGICENKVSHTAFT